MSSSPSLTITLDKSYIDSVKKIFSNPDDILFKTAGSRFNINKIEYNDDKNTIWDDKNNGDDNDIYSYTMVILEKNIEDIDIAIICQFNKNILDENYDYDVESPNGNDIVCQALYKETDKDKEYYIYIPGNNYGVGTLSTKKYDVKNSNIDVLFKVFIIKNVMMNGSEIFKIEIDSEKFATINRFDILKNNNPSLLPSDKVNTAELTKLNKSLFLLLYYINFHSFNVRFFSQLNDKFLGMTRGGITTTVTLPPPPEPQQITPVEPQKITPVQPQKITPVQPQQRPRNRISTATTNPKTRKIGSNGREEEEEVVIEEPGEEEVERVEAVEAEGKKAVEAERVKAVEAEGKKAVEAKRKKAEKEAEKKAEENNYTFEYININENDSDAIDYNTYNPATEKLIKYLFKNYKGTSEQKFSKLLEIHKDKTITITKKDFIGLSSDKTFLKNAEIWFNAEFPNKEYTNKAELLNAIEKNRYKVIYNEVASEEKKKNKLVELKAKIQEKEAEKLQKKQEAAERQKNEKLKKQEKEKAELLKQEAEKLRQKQEKETKKREADIAAQIPININIAATEKEKAEKKAEKEAKKAAEEAAAKEEKLAYLQASLKQKVEAERQEKEKAELQKKEEAERQKKEETERQKKEEAERLKKIKKAAEEVDKLLSEEEQEKNILEEYKKREEERAKEREQKREELEKRAERIIEKRKKENKIELQKIREREAKEAIELQRAALNAMGREERYRMTDVFDIKPKKKK